MLTNTNYYSGLSDVAAFICVVQAGSFTAAAEQLNTSKSVVSKYISRLEDRLGAKLLTRTTRRLTLTEVGRTFYQGASQGLEAIESAEEAVSFLQGKPRGTIRINAPLSFGALHIAPALQEFLTEYPEVQIDLRFEDRQIDMIKEGFDLTVRITRQLEGNLIARRIAPCRHVLVASPDYVQQHGMPKEPEDLPRHKIIAYQYQQSSREWEFTAAQGQPKRIAVDGPIQMNNSLAIREAILAGAGIARMPTFAVGGDIEAGRLVQLLSAYSLPELSIYLVFPQREYLAPKVRAFIDFMAHRLEGKPYWDGFQSKPNY
ncbi:LysR family transcriptional regulator [Bowmanella dokdonensis]|uniref:LysR family transcriptional regulator n=1 Tax=Bowmanella dokdonensis TaxID=751969 RepID=A0A939IMT0_9ALTE|nr:LysR family transcriptional regulator [Bowmanella dokdonensis]MBN7825628.1 LysR family transcriptional regulator [Bowmanella dokdonensis]